MYISYKDSVQLNVTVTVAATRLVGRHSRQLDMFSHDPVTFDRFAPE